MAEAAATAAPLLRVAGLRKAFPGVVALAGVDLEARAGEVLALVGENGAGKSTLLKIVAGAQAADAGRVELAGRDLRGRGPAGVAAAGVAVVHQEQSLVAQLSVRANLHLGREPGLGRLDARREAAAARAALARLGLEDLDPETPVARLDVARRQLVEIARALLADARLLILDEPTACLTPGEAERLFAILADLRARGLGVVFVSHRLEEVLRVADRVAVLRDGALVGEWPARDLDRARLVEAMVGRPLDREFPQRESRAGDVVLAARDVTGGIVRGVSLALRAGEVVGLAGLVGAGRTELARLLFGADRLAGGEVVLDGRALRLRSPRDAIAAGICLLTEDRQGQGLVLGLPARENFALGNLDLWSRGGWLDRRAEAAAFARFAAQLRLKVSSPRQAAGELSGGNQQKLLIARWLARDARVVIVDEPTRGIDVGAKHEIYLLLNELAARGKAVLMISSELPEVLGMSDRVLVMHRGRLAGEIADAARATRADVMALALRARAEERPS